jgi:broad specificity phosphatase PhoE
MLYLVRHGRTEANASGRLLGRLDDDLDSEGRRQAASLAGRLPTRCRVIASPLSRARQTAAAVAPTFEVDERWIEMDYGELDGRPLSDVPVETWQRWRADADFAPPGGESLRQLGRRVAEACEELAAASRDEDVVVVSHVSPIKAAVAWALDVGDELAWRTFVAPGSISVIGFGELGPVLRAFNETAHLE